MKAKIVIDSELCKGCSYCIEFCPKGILRLSDQRNAKGYTFMVCDDAGACTGCGTCALMCPEAAIEVYRD